MTPKKERSKDYASRAGNRYWWYKQEKADFVPTPLALLEDREWNLIDQWYSETDSIGLIGECGVPAISLLDGLITGGAISRIVQLGTFAGFSALLLGFTMRRHGFEQSLFSIDIDSDVCAYSRKWIQRADLDSFVRLEVGDSADSAMLSEATHWLGSKPQLVFVDSSHQYSHTLQELDLWYDGLAAGGILALHDASLFAQQFDPSAAGGVYRAVKEWQQERSVPVFHLNGGFAAGMSPERLIYGDPCGLAIIQKQF